MLKKYTWQRKKKQSTRLPWIFIITHLKYIFLHDNWFSWLSYLSQTWIITLVFIFVLFIFLLLMFIDKCKTKNLNWKSDSNENSSAKTFRCILFYKLNVPTHGWINEILIIISNIQFHGICEKIDSRNLFYFSISDKIVSEWISIANVYDT